MPLQRIPFKLCQKLKLDTITAKGKFMNDELVYIKSNYLRDDIQPHYNQRDVVKF